MRLVRKGVTILKIHLKIHTRRAPLIALLFGVMSTALVACQPDTVPNPTVIPTVIASVSPTPTRRPTSAVTDTPAPTFLPIVSATATTSAPVVAADVPTAIPTLSPICVVAKAGDSIQGLLIKGGYADLSAAPAFREANNMSPNSNNIQIGQQYCIPRPTSTPTPLGLEITQTLQARFIPTTGAMIIGDYVVKKDDTSLGLEAKFNVPLGVICKLNPLPDGLNCAGCDLNAAIFQAKCRVILREGQHLKMPGPTPTPSITPTLTGSETATPLPPYRAPMPLAPVNGGTVAGSPVRLEWLPIQGILGANEFYMLLMTDSTVAEQPRNAQYFTQTTSLVIPPDFGPQDAAPHTINWQVVVVRRDANGVVLLSEKSPPYLFTWMAG